MPITILLVDDHILFRKGLRLLIDEEPDMSAVGEAGDGKEALEKVRELAPAVVIMDISMPDFNGIDATRQIVSEVPSVKVVALSMHAGKRYVEDMLQAGAAGYILKKSAPEDLVNGIRTVVQGDVYLSPTITGVVVSKYKELLAQSALTAHREDTLPILRTKLQRPALSPDLVPRSDLVDRLDELRRRPLTLVSSAAGYGKSTMASLWLEAWNGPYAWLSLNGEESDLRKFISYLIAAIENAFPGSCDTTRSLLQTPELAADSVLSQHLVNDIDKIETPFILVLDDFHKIRGKTVHDLIGALLIHPPQSLHLMLLTRRDPPLLTSTLRARDRVNEIGTEDLHFTVAETKVFLKNTLGLTVDRKTAEIIQEKLEGWPAGMRLMSQSLKYSGDLDRLLAELRGGFATITDYLVTEVLSKQPSQMAKLMTATATLDQFCAPLCDALLELDAGPGAAEMNGDEFIARLQKDNLFLIALDTENRWFRYHHMFRRLLHDRLNRYCRPEEIAALHSRAKAWFAENDISDDAKKHIPAAFKEGEHRTVPEATDDESPSPYPPLSESPSLSTSPFPSPQALVDSLTNREMDILELLQQRLGNKEIAEKLFISTATVKGHLQNIYGKLNVSKRREAVEKAKKIGIL
jgi:ATP/maltotriose-dependent transcriptional regulator MalT/ActR/RegA family two-component response regulator